MPATIDDRTALPLDEPARAHLREAVHRLHGVARRKLGKRARLVDPDGSSIELPDVAYRLFLSILEDMSEGQAVIVQTTGRKLTTGQVAQFLGVSRPTVVRLLESGEIPYEQAGTHRRVKLADAEAYRNRSKQQRLTALDEMAFEAAESGLDDETDSLPNRGE